VGLQPVYRLNWRARWGRWLKLAGEMGSLVAAYALEHVGTQNHRFTLPEFITRFRTQFDDGGQLDALVKSAAV